MPEYVKPALVLYNGVPVLRATESDCEVRSNDNAVYELSNGLAGFSDGAEEMMINVQNSIPVGGIEIDWLSLARTHATIEIGFRVPTSPSRTYTARGRVMTASLRSSVNAAFALNMSFQGRIVSVV